MELSQPSSKLALCVTRESFIKTNRDFPKTTPVIGVNSDPVFRMGMPPIQHVFNHLDFVLAIREECETNPELLQLIPYVTILVFDDTNNTYKLLSYKRGEKSNEGRLINNLSIGFGGHIETPCAGTLLPDGAILKDNSDPHIKVIVDSLLAELKEEIGLTFDIEYIKMLTMNLIQGGFSFIYTDANDVSKVHLGISVIVQVSKKIIDALKPDGREITDFELLSFKEIENKISQGTADYEEWSKIALYNLTRNVNNHLKDDLEKLKELPSQWRAEITKLENNIALFSQDGPDNPIIVGMETFDKNVIDINISPIFKDMIDTNIKDKTVFNILTFPTPVAPEVPETPEEVTLVENK